MNKKLSIVLSIALCISLCANVFVYKYVKAEGNDDVKTTVATADESEDTESDMRYIISNGNGESIKVLDCNSNEVEGELPVEIAVKYFLDGSEVNAEALNGVSGHVLVRYDFTNNSSVTEKIAGKDEKIYTPYACICGMMMDAENAENVSVSSGKVIDDGSRFVVLGLAFPGMQENVDLDTDKIDIPEYVEIEFDAKDYTCETSYAVVSGNIFNDLDIDDVNADEIKDDMNEMTDAMAKLIDGSEQLVDGFDTLNDGLKTYTDGVATLSDGLNKISANNKQLTDGSKQVFDMILATANTSLKEAGVDAPELTVDNYGKVLDGIIAGMNPDGAAYLAQQKVEAEVREKAAGYPEEQIQMLIKQTMASDEVQAQIAAGKKQIEAGIVTLKTLKGQLDSYNTFYTGINQYTAGVASAAKGAKELNSNSAKLFEGTGELKDGAVKLSDGLKEFDEKAVDKLVSLVDDDLTGYADRINAIKNAAKENTDTNNYVFKIN